VNGQTFTVRPKVFINEGKLEQANGGVLVAPGFP
jgi:hypothetical protein